MKHPVRETIGWIGVMAILAAYFLINIDVLDVRSLPYLFLNLGGSIAIGYDAYKQKNYQPVVLNIIWAAVAIIGLMRVSIG